jgi:hypothetical protein
VDRFLKKIKIINFFLNVNFINFLFWGFVGDFSLVVGECFLEKRKLNFLGVSDCQIWKKKKRKKRITRF